MQEPIIQPLVVTPRPKQGESYMGFILRTSEMNRYTTPTHILNYAGMSNNEVRSVRPPLEKLAKLYGRDVEEFSSINYGKDKNTNYDKVWKVQGVLVPSMYLNIKAAKICPECIIEKGYIESYWDLKHAFVCPIHKRKAITVCPNCGKDLNWFRKGLMTCRCGQELSKLRGEYVEDVNELAMFDLIRSKLQGFKFNKIILEESGFPTKELSEIKLSTLLGIIYKLKPGRKRKTNFNVPIGVSEDENAIKLASGILSRWPEGFYDYLESLHKEKAVIVGTTLQKQFHQFFNSFFKNGLPENEMKFFKKAFVGFGNERWKTNGYIDTRTIKSVDANSNIVGIKGLAEALGIMPPTAMKYVKQGLIKGRMVNTAKGKREIFDLTKIPFKRSKGKYYKTREASKFIGIPESLLAMLKKQKIYTLKHLAYGLDGYSEIDLIDFRDSLLIKAHKLIHFEESKHITLKKIMLKKPLGNMVKSKFIESVLNKSILPIGNVGSNVGDIIFKRNEALSFVNLLKES